MNIYTLLFYSFGVRKFFMALKELTNVFFFFLNIYINKTVILQIINKIIKITEIRIIQKSF